MNDTTLRNDLAAAHRLALRLGLTEGLSNHFSARLASHPDRFLITPLGVYWSQIQPDDLLVLDSQGRVVDGAGEMDPSAYHLHSQILRARSDVSCIMHTHQPHATAIALLKGGRLLPISQLALRFHERIAYHEIYHGAADNREDAQELAQALGKRSILIHSHHGVLTAANSVARAFDDLFFLERAARLQILAQSTGQELSSIAPEVGARYTSEKRENNLGRQALQHFESLKRALESDEL